ncbi:MAG: tetratricopeptide repeat protein [Candidatus Omnitrophota bacterium]
MKDPKCPPQRPMTAVSMANILFLLALFLIPLALYQKAFSFDFLNWDDNYYVYNNPHIRSFAPENITAWFTHTYVRLYVPITLASYALDYLCFGPQAWGYHVTNVGLHLLNIFLAFLLFRRLTPNRGAALLGALLFGLHPAQTDTVAWISERKTLLYSFFILVAWLLWTRKADPAWQKKVRLPAVFLLFFLALLAKPVAALFPLLMMGSAYFSTSTTKPPLRRPVLLIMLAITAALGTLTFFFHLELFSEKGIPGAQEIFLYPWLRLGLYLRILLAPAFLSPDYPSPDIYLKTGGPELWIPLLASLLAVMLSAIGFLRKTPWGFWAFFALLWLLPVLSPIAVQVRNHHLYLSILGFCALWIIGLRARPRLLILLLILLNIACFGFSWQKIGVWKNTETLWNSVLAQRPDNFIAHLNLGNHYQEKGDLDRAESHYQAILHKTHGKYAYANLISLYLAQKRAGDAEALTAEMEKRYPDHPDLYFFKASLAHLTGKPEEAESWLRRSLEAGSKNPTVFFNLGMIHLSRREPEKAEPLLEQAVRLNVAFSEALYFLGISRLAMAKYPEALATFQRMLKSRLRLPGTDFQLGFTYYKLGNISKARSSYLDSIRNDPEIAEAYYHLGLLYADAPSIRRAYLEQALRRDPGNPKYAAALEQTMKASGP